MQNRGGNATRHWHGAAATTLAGSLRRFVTGDPATAAFGWKFAVRPSIRERQLKRPTPDIGTGRLAPSAYGLGWPKAVGPLYPYDRDTFYYGGATGYSDYPVYGGTAHRRPEFPKARP
jgi:hypothetical protein